MQEFVIKPNNSLVRRDLKLLGGLFALVLFLLAARLWLMGFWVVVPFLLLDFLAVVIAFYLIRKKCCIYESIFIDENQLKISHHEKRRSKSWSFDIHWVKIKLQEHEHAWQSSRMLVGSHGKWIEFASFLTDEERASLARALNISIQEQLTNA